MERYDRLYRLYREFDADGLRERQQYLDVFPPVDSQLALAHWQEARESVDERKARIREAFDDGDVLAAIAARATREQAFRALDLHSKYGRAVDCLVCDVDETLRSAGRTDDEIPRDALYLLRTFHEAEVPIVVCTGKTLENVKGFVIQGLGNEVFHSGRVSVVYEAGCGVFTPGHGSDTKRLLYEGLDDDVLAVFDAVRTRALRDAPLEVRSGCHLQGNEFNVTFMTNAETGSGEAEAVIDRALVYVLDLVGDVVAGLVADEGDGGDGRADADDGAPRGTRGEPGGDDPGPDEGADPPDDPGVAAPSTSAAWARAHFAAADREIRAALDRQGALPAVDADEVPEDVGALLDRLDVGYYRADAAELTSLELDKAAGVRAALDVLDVRDPFLLVMGDSKSDLRVMEWVAEQDCGISAAPEHASEAVLEHVAATDELTFEPGDSADVLRTVYALNQVAEL
jgi:hydroxymethylpyrimidine pyrophosphatase-like HAD family hydrolase